MKLRPFDINWLDRSRERYSEQLRLTANSVTECMVTAYRVFVLKSIILKHAPQIVQRYVLGVSAKTFQALLTLAH